MDFAVHKAPSQAQFVSFIERGSEPADHLEREFGAEGLSTGQNREVLDDKRKNFGITAENVKLLE